MITQVREFYRIEFLEDVPCLYWQMRGDIGSEDFKQAVMCGYEAFKKYKVDNANISLIIDLSLFTPIEKVDIDWVNNDIMPLLYVNNGVRIIALVLPSGGYASEVAAEFHLKTEQLHVIGICSSVDEAKAWIKNGADSQKVVGDYTMFA